MSLAALLTSMLSVAGAATAAQAETVYELAGEWAEDTPETVATGDAVNTQWWFNLNDDAAAPGNEPVEDVTLTIQAQNAVFEEIPSLCQTEDVSPESSIEDDGATLVCNVGSQDQGSAITLNAAMTVTGESGEDVNASAELADQSTNLEPLTVQNPFVQDIQWNENTGRDTFDESTGTRTVEFNWTLFHGAYSPDGPDEVTYTLNVSNTLGADMSVGAAACSAFTEGTATGHPWSGGGHDSEQTAPTVDSCTLTQIDNGTYELTLTGIDYSHATVPTKDSTGGTMPTDRVAVAAGVVEFDIDTTETSGGVDLESSAPTYTAVDGSTSEDDPDNNSSATTWIRGFYSGSWQHTYTGGTGGYWADTYRVAPGIEVRSNTSGTYSNIDTILASEAGFCTILDTKYVTFENAEVVDAHYGHEALEGVTIEYYTGGADVLDPTSTNYDPNKFNNNSDNEFEACGGSSGWTSTEPSDLSDVRAVRTVFPINDADGGPHMHRDSRPSLYVKQTIHEDVEIGTDVWVWGGYIAPGNSNNNWLYPNRGDDPADAPASSTSTPDARYAFTASMRDLLRIVGVTPTVDKSVTPTTIDPGGSASYTLEYSGDGSGSIPETVNDYTITDTLPDGATYVDGSASPEPTVDGQTLTWNLDDVATNETHELSYDVDFADDIDGGDRLTNTVQTSLDGVNSEKATASVTVNDAGLTQVAKSADQAYIPNIDGDGAGEGSWTVSVVSQDPLPQDFTDTIDILPYEGDDRGTSISDGSYSLDGEVDAPDATVYYTTADPETLSDDPADTTNGAANDPSGNTVGWSTDFDADATAVRVITGTLAARDTYEFTIPIVTDGMGSGDELVNRAQGRAENTRLVMRTSAPTTIATYYSASLKKYVQDVDGEWHDANDELTYPTFRVGDEVNYRIVVENTGQGTLTGIEVSDDEQPDLGSFTIDSLEPGEEDSHEFSITLEEPLPDSIVNTACAEADIPDDSVDDNGDPLAPEINCDPAGFIVVGTPTHSKTLDSATPIGDGQWEVVYDVTVENTETPSTVYDLDDELRFTDQAEILSAEVTAAPDDVTLTDPAWDGQENLTIAQGVDLAGYDDEDYEPHVYELTVIADVPSELEGAGGNDDPTQCGAEGSEDPRAFTNTSELTDPDGEIEDDWACAELPSISITKSVADGPVPNGDGSWTVTYDVLVSNEGAADGDYDLDDSYTPADGLTVDSASITVTPDGVDIPDNWTGQGDEGSDENRIASGITLPGGEVHTYSAEMIISLDDTDEPGSVPSCEDPDGGTGGLVNAATIEHNDLEGEDVACVSVASIQVGKTIADGPSANGDGTWDVTYDLEAENIGGATGTYDLSDQLHFGDGIIIDAAEVTVAPDGVSPLDSWTGLGDEGSDENFVVQGVDLAASQIHTYSVTVTVELDFDEVEPSDLTCPEPGSGETGGLANSTGLDHNGIADSDDVCASLPLIDIEKQINEGPSGNDDGTWTISYDLTATNAGEAEGDYDLDDQLQYGDGIVIESATTVPLPDQPDPLDSWTGQGGQGTDENRVASGVTIDSDEQHRYRIEVVVSLESDVNPDALKCPEPGESGGLANTTTLSHNGQDKDDTACASLPSIEITKAISGAVAPVDDEPGQYDVTYDLTVFNYGPGEGTYDLNDELAPGEGIEVIDIQQVTTDTPDSVGLNSDFDGIADTTIVTDQSIDGATVQPVEHVYTVVVRYEATLGEVELPAAPECTIDGESAPGALNNNAGVTWNGIEDEDDECVQPGKPTLDKELTSAVPVGDGQWQVDYDLTVGNVGQEATTYDLEDEFLFAPDVTVDSVDLSGPADVDLESDFDGGQHQQIATNAAIAGLADEDYAPHVYRVTVIANVPAYFDAGDEDGTGSPACTTPGGENFTEQGLNNAATVTDETGGSSTDTDCAALPSISVDKTMDGAPKQDDDGQWLVAYEIIATNDGATEGEYTLTDELRFGAGIAIESADVTQAPEGTVLSKTWTGQGKSGDASNVIATDVSLDADTTHRYIVEVTATVDQDKTDSTTFTCAEPGSSEAGGFTNVAGLGHNDVTVTDQACDVPDEPTSPPSSSGWLPVTGAMIPLILLPVGLLMLGAGVLVRRKTRKL